MLLQQLKVIIKFNINTIMDSKLIRKKLLEKSSLPTGNEISDKQDIFNEIVDILKEIQQGKAKLYGDYFERLKENTNSINILSNFIEIQEKYCRIKNIIMNNEGKAHGKDESIIADLLLDSYVDLAIYGIMGLGVLGEIISKNNAEDLCGKK